MYNFYYCYIPQKHISGGKTLLYQDLDLWICSSQSIKDKLELL